MQTSDIRYRISDFKGEQSFREDDIFPYKYTILTHRRVRILSARCFFKETILLHHLASVICNLTSVI